MLIAAIIATMTFIFWPRASALSADFEETERLIKKDVHDEARRDQALKIVEQAEKAIKGHEDERKKLVEPLEKVLSRRDAQADQIEAALAPIEAAAAAAAQKQTEWRFELKSVLTESEWTQVFAPAPAKTPEGKADGEK